VAEIERLRDLGGAPAADLVTLFGRIAERAITAANAAEEKSLLAAMLTLPDAGYLFEQAEAVDVDGTCQALRALHRAVAERHLPLWRRLVDGNRAPGTFSADPVAMARRRLKHAALALLMPALDGAEAGALLADLCRHADNLTDRRAALQQLMHHDGIDAGLRAELLGDFLERWQHEALVVDQWLALQAASPVVDAQAVRVLAAHPAFDARNPNKLRALYGTFARHNHERFHARDGAGYRLLGEVVVAVDAKNPSMAAALAKPLTRWRRYDPVRSHAMRTALETIAGAERLSRDLYEVVTKGLA
jgi:aminopeptidase N